MSRKSASTEFLNLIGGSTLILLATLIVYWPSLRGEFLWDDDILITKNAHMYASHGLKHIWLGIETPDYFPLTLSMFWFEWKVFGMNPLGYHVVNVVLHALGAVILWRTLLLLKIPGAFLAGIIFALHPFCVSSVAWIAERKNTLSLVFFLLALFCFFKFEATAIERNKALKPGRWGSPGFWYGLSIFTFLLALLSKTSVVMLPPVLLVSIWWQRGKIEKGDIVRLLPFFALSVILGFVTLHFQAPNEFYKADPSLVRILGGGLAIWFYLCKTIIPLNLSMIYSRWVMQPGSLLAWLPWFLWLVTLGTAWFFRRSWGKHVLFALAYFFITLFPVLGFFDMSFFAFSNVADHLAYLSIIGIVVLIASSVGICGDYIKNRMALRIFGTLIVCVLAGLSWNRAGVFASSEKLWRDTLKKNPQAWAAHNNLGEALAWKGDIEKAAEMFRSALRLNPEYARANFNLGNACLHLNQTEDAFVYFENAVRIWPDYAEAENSWGLGLLRANRTSDAILHFQKAVQFAPNYFDARCNLADAFAQQRQLDEAVKSYRAALQIRPVDAEVRLNLGLIFNELGQLDEAETEFKEVIRLQPTFAEAHNGLGIVMTKRKRTVDAVRCFQEVLRIDPGNSAAQENLLEIQKRL